MKPDSFFYLPAWTPGKYSGTISGVHASNMPPTRHVRCVCPNVWQHRAPPATLPPISLHRVMHSYDNIACLEHHADTNVSHTPNFFGQIVVAYFCYVTRILDVTRPVSPYDRKKKIIHNAQLRNVCRKCLMIGLDRQAHTCSVLVILAPLGTFDMSKSVNLFGKTHHSLV